MLSFIRMLHQGQMEVKRSREILHTVKYNQCYMCCEMGTTNTNRTFHSHVLKVLLLNFMLQVLLLNFMCHVESG